MPTRLKAISSTRIQWAVALGSLLLLALLWFVAITELRAQESWTVEAAIRENRNRAAAFEQYVARTLESADLAAIHVADHHSNLAPVERPGRPAFLTDQVARNPLFAGVIVSDSNGNVRTTTFRNAPPLNIAESRTFQRYRANPANDRLAISKPGASPFADRPLIALTRAIRREDGSFGGVVIVQIAAERLVEFTRGATTRPLDLISVIRDDGISLARREGQRVSFGEDLRGTQVMREQAANPDGSYLGPSALDGLRRFFSHRRMEEYGIFVTAGLGEDDVVSAIRSRSKLVLAGLIALTLAILAFNVSTIGGMRRREAAARALETANRRLSEAQRIARIGDWEYDPGTGEVHLSDELCGMYGLAPSGGRRAGDDIAAFFEPDQQKIWFEAVERAIAEGTPQECQLQADLPGGPSCRRVTMEPRTGPDGSIDMIVGTDQDITREREHERLRDQVAHSARVEVMNAMAATIAHELAQPLTAASNYLASAKRLRERGAPGSGARTDKMLDQVGRQIDVTRTIMRRVWEMVANRRSNVQRASLVEAVQDAVALVKIGHEHPHVAIVQELSPAASFVRADQIQIQQVLVNIVRNAIEAASESETREVTISSRLVGDQVELCVADSGAGIAAGRPDIFSPFASTKGGLGLGLSISRMIVESFGGRIWADREAPQGARICISLPAADRPNED